MQMFFYMHNIYSRFDHRARGSLVDHVVRGDSEKEDALARGRERGVSEDQELGQGQDLRPPTPEIDEVWAACLHFVSVCSWHFTCYVQSCEYCAIWSCCGWS